MKYPFTSLATAVLAALSVLACTKSNIDGPTGGGGDNDLVPAVIHAGIGSENTRAHDSEWDEDDAIGLAMLSQDGTEVFNDAYNYHYVSSEQRGVFVPHNGEMMIYFPADGSFVSFRGYYPFYSGLDEHMVVPIDVTNQSKLPEIDFMSAVPEGIYSKSTPAVKLYFHHRLTKIIVNLGADNQDAFGALEDCTVTIRGMKTTGSYALLPEQLTVDNGSEAPLTFPMRDKVADQRYGIVLPRKAGEGVEFDFTFPKGQKYTAKMDSNLELLAGYQYIFNINLKETPATISAEIAPWEDGPERTWDAVQASVKAGPSKNVPEETVMDVFISEDNADFGPLMSFTYDNGKWVPDQEVYWEEIPYDPAYMRSSILMEEPLNSTQTGDLLVSDQIGVDRNSAAHFTLERAVSKLYVDLVSPDGYFSQDELDAAVITLPDFLTGGYLDNGRFIEGTTRWDILMADDEQSGNRVALFQPQSVSTGGTVVRVTLNDRTYNATVESGGYTFEAGIAEHFVIRLYQEEVTISATIVDWEDGPSVSWKAVQISTAAGESHNVEPGDKIDLYMLRGTSYGYLSSFVYNSDGTWNPAPIAYWEDIPTDPAYFIARMDVAGPLETSQLPDVLLSEPTRGYSNTGIDFVLTHAAAKVTVTLVSDTFSDDQMRNAIITLPGYTVGGQFVDQRLVGGSTNGDILVHRTGDNSGVAIFEPQTVRDGQTAVRIQFGNNTYNAPAPDGGFEFKAGMNTNLIVRYEKGTFSISARVIDWEDDGTYELEALKVLVEEGITDGVRDGEVMDIYYGAQREELSSYTWTGGNWSSSTPVYWEDLDDPETFYASILRQPAYNSTMPDDYLLSGATTVSAPNAVNFELSHAVAQVAVRLISSDETFTQAQLNAMDVILPNYRSGGYYDKGIFYLGTGYTNVEVEKGVGDNNNSGLAFVEPQTIPAGTIVATVAGTSMNYRVTSAQDIVYRAGYTTVLEINLRETAVLMSAKVVDWTEGPTITMVPAPIPITGDLEDNAGFFEGKTIYVYNLTDGERYPYTYQNGHGQAQISIGTTSTIPG